MLVDQSEGPSANEDLNIAEQLQTMRMPEKDRLGELCFVNEHRQCRWVGPRKATEFIRHHGAQHSSNYLALHGTEWEQDFFSGC